MKQLQKLFLLLFLIFLVSACAGSQIEGSLGSLATKNINTYVIASDNILANAVESEMMKRGFRLVEKTSLYNMLGKDSTEGFFGVQRAIQEGRSLGVDAVIFVTGQYATYQPGKISTAFIKVVSASDGTLLGTVTYQNGSGCAPGSPCDSVMKDTLLQSAKKIVDIFPEPSGVVAEQTMPIIKAEAPITEQPSQQEEKIKFTGTGFILNLNGFMITNFHVVRGSKEIKITTSDGEKANATVILKDVSNDIAVLKLDSVPRSINSKLFFGDSSKMKEGDKVFTIGYPFSNILGKQARYTEGTISSLYGIQDDPRWFQISVPIQPGNSGGPLFNEKGEVIGITIASLDAKNVFEITGAVPQNINFAIKSAYIKNLLSMLPDLGSALVMPTDLKIVRKEPKSFIERIKNNIVLIETE